MEYTGGEELEILKHAKNYNQFLVKRVTSSIHGRQVLDFGAGIGTFADFVKSSSNIEVESLEVDKCQRDFMISQGHKVYGSINEIKDLSFDSIYSLNVLEHIADDQSAIDDIFKKLKSGGIFYCYVPAFQILYGEFDQKVGHERRYSKKELIQKIKKAGFFVKSSRYCDSLGFFAALLFKYVNNSGTINLKMVKTYDRFIFPLSHFIDFITFGKLVGKNIEVIAHKVE